MRHLKFTLGGINERPPFNSLITESAAFQFDQSNIPRIRNEIATLIDNLSKIYMAIKELKDAEEKKAKRARKTSALTTCRPASREEAMHAARFTEEATKKESVPYEEDEEVEKEESKKVNEDEDSDKSNGVIGQEWDM